jgi:hypothetical protein
MCITGFLILARWFQYISDDAIDYDMTNFFSKLYYVTIASGIISVIWELYVGSYCAKKIESTYMSVYEDNVKGVAVDKDFSFSKLIFFAMGWDKARLINFDLAFNQISSVYLENDNAIIIYASGAQHKCFVSNGYEIQSAINNKIRNSDASTKSDASDTRKLT